MIKLPEHLRGTLERTVNRLKSRDDVYGVGLFGSWSRGEATESSDIDLMILNKGGSYREYVERFETAGLFIDLYNVPKKLFLGVIPPELDQKLNEMKILYDRDWSFTNTKLLMTKCYGSSERVAIRTERHILNADIYLSRATSAFSRGDYRSAHVFSVSSAEAALNVLVEIAGMPFSNSNAVARLNDSAAKLDMHYLFDKFWVLSGFGKVDEAMVNAKLKLFRGVWDEMNAAVTRNHDKLEKCHFAIRAKLLYYLNPSFIRGALARTHSIVASGNYVEAQHYLKAMFLDALESYVQFHSVVESVRVDCVMMMRSLEILTKKSPRDFDRVIDFLDLAKADKSATDEMIKKSRALILTVRGQRKVLIKNQSIKG